MKRATVLVTLVASLAVLVGSAPSVSAAPPPGSLTLTAVQDSSQTCRLNIDAEWTRYRPDQVSFSVLRRDIPTDVSVLVDFIDMPVARRQTAATWSVTIDPAYNDRSWFVYVYLIDRHEKTLANTYQGPIDMSTCTAST